MIGKLLGTICKFVGGFVLVCLLATACLGGEPKEKQEDVAEVPQIAKDLAEEESVSNIPEEQPEIVDEGEEGPNIPFEFIQALDKAQSYVDLMAFSQADLRGQLEYHSFSYEAIEFALENVEVDYQAECIEKAESYLDFTSFSEADLREQLEYHEFNEEHINVAIDKVYR